MGDTQGIMGNSLGWAKPPAGIPFSAKVRRKLCAGEGVWGWRPALGGY